MNTYQITLANEAHYATFNVTADTTEAAIFLCKSEMLELSREEWEMQYTDEGEPRYESTQDFDTFLYRVCSVQPADHEDKLKMIDSGGNG